MWGPALAAGNTTEDSDMSFTLKGHKGSGFLNSVFKDEEWHSLEQSEGDKRMS